jgi:hypothetical protein
MSTAGSCADGAAASDRRQIKFNQLAERRRAANDTMLLFRAGVSLVVTDDHFRGFFAITPAPKPEAPNMHAATGVSRRSGTARTLHLCTVR